MAYYKELGEGGIKYTSRNILLFIYKGATGNKSGSLNQDNHDGFQFYEAKKLANRSRSTYRNSFLFKIVEKAQAVCISIAGAWQILYVSFI
jgi:hypothetical protein